MSDIPSISQILSRLYADEHEEADPEPQPLPRQAPQHPAAESSLAVLSRMAQFVAHDFRHHLSAVYSNTEFLCDASYTQPEREQLFEEIKTAILRMTETLDSVLLFSQTGRMFHLRLEPLKLIVERAVQMVRSHPDAHKVTFIDEVMPLVEVHGDSTWLCSAIFNLLLNACQAAQNSSLPKEVRISCQQDQSSAFIRIMDNGPGISPSIQKSIFQPFVSLRRQKGTGLGLAIAKSVARGHEGDIYLEDSSPGRTTFVLRLPRPAAAASNEMLAQPQSTGQRCSRSAESNRPHIHRPESEPAARRCQQTSKLNLQSESCA